VFITERPVLRRRPELTAPATEFAGSKRFQLGGFDGGVNRFREVIHIEAQAAEFLFYFEHLELLTTNATLRFHQVVQACAKAPENSEPSVPALETEGHQGMAQITCGVEPGGPAVSQLLL
jgi:hypothetical protein